jgi:hypothetical protein
MTPRDFIRTAIAIRLQTGGAFGNEPHSADVIEVPSAEADEFGRCEMVTARVAVWSERGRVRGQLLEIVH